MQYKGHHYEQETSLDARCITLFHNPSGLVLSEATSVFASQFEIEQILDDLIHEADMIQANSDQAAIDSMG